MTGSDKQYSSDKIRMLHTSTLIKFLIGLQNTLTRVKVNENVRMVICTKYNNSMAHQSKFATGLKSDAQKLEYTFKKNRAINMK
jgi:hypothetical protein